MMRRRAPLWVAAALAITVVSIQPKPAAACSCVPPPPPAESLEASAAVFEAEVKALAQPDDPPWVRATMRVIRAWKGASSPEVTVITAASSAACGLELAVGDRWLIYASEVDGELHAGLCSRSAVSRSAEADFSALGAPAFGSEAAPPSDPEPAPAAPPTEPPSAAPPPEASAGGCAGCTTAPGSPGAAAALLLLACLARRRRR
jgi:MYXO-CTERM domain-containing protein